MAVLQLAFAPLQVVPPMMSIDVQLAEQPFCMVEVGVTLPFRQAVALRCSVGSVFRLKDDPMAGMYRITRVRLLRIRRKNCLLQVCGTLLLEGPA